MPFFTKKPVTIEAVQFDGTEENFNLIWAWACPSDDTLQSPIHCGNLEGGEDDYTVVYIKTLEGEVTASPGDWIIKGVEGEFYPCKPSIFSKTYDPALGE